MKTRRKVLIALGVVVAVLVLGGIYALAQTDGEINACVLKDGTLRIVPDANSCKKAETRLTWNITGPQGPQGEQGIPGEPGQPGPASIDALQGTPCTVGANAGTVNVTVGTDGIISLACTVPPQPKKVFITDLRYNGNLGGLDGADQLCQTLAGNASLSGTFKAWLSDGTESGSPSNRFTHSTDPYVLVNGVQIADDWAHLTDGSLDAPINVTQTGASLSSGYGVWTGTAAGGGPASDNCSGWTTDSAFSGTIGGSGDTNSFWTDMGMPNGCNWLAKLYCFQQ